LELSLFRLVQPTFQDVRILDISTASESLCFCSVLHLISRPTEDRQNPEMVSLGRWVWTGPKGLVDTRRKNDRTSGHNETRGPRISDGLNATGRIETTARLLPLVLFSSCVVGSGDADESRGNAAFSQSCKTVRAASGLERANHFAMKTHSTRSSGASRRVTTRS
jgi:hypothetical protein